MRLKVYFLSWCGPVCFIASFMLQVLNRAHFKVSLDAATLTIFLLALLPKSHKWISPFSWIALLASWYAYHNYREPLYFLSQALSIYLTSKGIEAFRKQSQELEETNSALNFYQARLQDLLIKHQSLQDKFDALLSLDLIPGSSEEVKEERVCQDYDQDLDLLEKSVYSEFLEQPKEEKKPLRRLKKIAMKQTSFLEDL